MKVTARDLEFLSQEVMTSIGNLVLNLSNEIEFSRFLLLFAGFHNLVHSNRISLVQVQYGALYIVDRLQVRAGRSAQLH